MHVEPIEVFMPMYEPLEVTKCEKCDKIIAEPKELILCVISISLASICL